MRIHKVDKQKTAFQTWYEYQVMPFALSNILNSFQGYIHKILAKKFDIFGIVYLNDIFVYTKNSGQPHVEVICQVLKQLQKYDFFANLKNCRFYQNEIAFLGFHILVQGIRIEENRITVVKSQPEPKSVRYIQVFFGFANCYRKFVKNFNKIPVPLSLILQTTAKSTDVKFFSIQIIESQQNQDAPLNVGEADRVDASNGSDKNPSNAGKQKNLTKSKKPKLAKSQKLNQTLDFARANFSKIDFLHSRAKKAFIRLQKAFTKAPIIYHLDSKTYIWIETNISSFTIGRILSQIDLDQSSFYYVIHKTLHTSISSEIA